MNDSTHRRVNVLVDVGRIVLQNWRLSQHTTRCAIAHARTLQNRIVAAIRILAASSVENRHRSRG